MREWKEMHLEENSSNSSKAQEMGRKHYSKSKYIDEASIKHRKIGWTETEY